jgi:hypothetical protein
MYRIGAALEKIKRNNMKRTLCICFLLTVSFAQAHYFADPKEQLIGIIFTQQYFSPYWSNGEMFRNMVYQAIGE